MTRDTLPDIPDTECTAFLSGRERYVFFWTIDRRDVLFRTLGRFAANPDLSLSWYDAAVVTHRVRDYLRTKGVTP